MNDYNKIGVIILAAGSSSRLGSPKQLVQYRGKALLQHTIDTVKTLDLKSNVLVLGAHSEMINEAIDDQGFETVFNSVWKEGMASSIRIGLDTLIKLDTDIEHVMILVSDQPFISAEEMEALLNFHIETGQDATFSEYDGGAGVPAVFSAVLFPELEKLEGDQGAKGLFKRSDLNFGTHPFKKGNFDVDTPEDVRQLKELE
ncbi:nucleotidyltransferase family protein [Gramella sp. BOM4]|nr:nucleotidyltransferase family protein [Christiangramia bathymodioli]